MVVETTRIGFFTRIKNAIAGVLVGILLFFASFVVLYVNEGLQKLSAVVEDATLISGSETNVEGVIKYTGTVSATSPIRGDNQFLSGGEFLFLDRTVEVFSWDEIQTTTTDSNVGGSQTQTTSYSYEKRWLGEPTNSSSFKEPAGHENKQKTIFDSRNFSSGVSIGNYSLTDVRNIKLHNIDEINLSDYTVSGDVFENRVFISKTSGSTYSNPAIGDHRITYRGIELNEEMTFVGALRSGNLRKYDDEVKAYDLFVGDSKDAQATAKKEDSFRIWMLRLVGFLMMAIGLFMVVNPFVILLDVIPIFGSVGRFVALLASFLIAFVMSLLTILVSIIFHNVIALSVTIVLSIVVAIYFFRKKR